MYGWLFLSPGYCRSESVTRFLARRNGKGWLCRSGGTIVTDARDSLLLKCLLYALSFASSVLVARGLGPDGRGRYALPIVSAATVVAISKLGVDQTNVFLVGARGYRPSELARQNATFAIIAGGVGCGLLLYLWALVPSVFGSSSLTLMLLAGLTIPLSLHTQFSSGLQTLGREVVWQFQVSILAAVSQLAALATLVGLRTLTVESALGINLTIATLTWALTVFRFEPLACLRPQWDWKLLKETLRHSIVVHLGMVLFFLHLRLDMFMLEAFSGPSALGQYAVSVSLAETVLIPSDSLAVAMLPRQVGSSVKEAASLALKGARLSIASGVLLAVGWIVAGHWVIALFYGRLFNPALLPLLALLPGVVLLGAQRCAGGPVLRAGAPWKFPAIYGASLCCNVFLNVFLIPIFGAAGAGIASSVSYAIGACMFLMWTAHLAQEKLLAGLLVKREDILELRSAIARLLGRSASANQVVATR
jgi:O-antigen/teichoic acid export membrane protein